MEELYTVNELSEKIKYSRSTIYRWLGERSIPCHRLGRQIRFSESDVMRIISLKATNKKEYNYGHWHF